LARAIAAQALDYVGAIDLSVDAAQKAYSVAEEAVSLGALIPKSTLDEHQRYLVGMLELARNGHNIAVKTLQKFKGVREHVHAVGQLFFVYSPALSCCGQLLKQIKPENEGVIFEFAIYLNGRSMSVRLHLCP
jgi:hypothetical protein